MLNLADTAPLPGYPEPFGTLLAALQDATAEWRDELGKPESDLIVWQPYPAGHSIGGVLLHLAGAESYWIETVCLGRKIDAEEAKRHMSTEIDHLGGSWPRPPEEPIAYYYDLLDKVRARTLQSVKAFGPIDAVRETGWSTVTLRWVLAHLIWHESYHGGQAVLLQQIGTNLRGLGTQK